jgi:hypothetical protein
MDRPEPDRQIGERPFGPAQKVGAQLLEDPWIKAAVAIMAARAAKEDQPAEPAKRKAKGE